MSRKKYVYVVIYRYENGLTYEHENHGIYTTKEKAEAARNDINNDSIKVLIEEVELNKEIIF